ncbi:unnamed protein product [Bursaphelenchus xylophilus]|uniref:(pine wood nematode) hypothetical protein n=1 Tax=Bursaphelenchus xylophilus TaxID=6326 RepID=A0A1I7RHK3_BURXY|nr:unnamed protein product [Bursaphelenchus xylophilus]CAG9115653.1 unnamed protein product [Bursaphelenchus xylophilus]
MSRTSGRNGPRRPGSHGEGEDKGPSKGFGPLNLFIMHEAEQQRSVGGGDRNQGTSDVIVKLEMAIDIE